VRQGGRPAYPPRSRFGHEPFLVHLMRHVQRVLGAQTALVILALAAAAVAIRHAERVSYRLAETSLETASGQTGSLTSGLQWRLGNGCALHEGTGRGSSCRQTGTERLLMTRLALRGGASEVSAPSDAEVGAKRRRSARELDDVGWEDKTASEAELKDAQVQAWDSGRDIDAPGGPGATEAGAHAGGVQVSVEAGPGGEEIEGPTQDEHYVLPSVLLPSSPTAGLQDFTAQMLRDIPFLEQQEHLEGDRQYAKELEEKQRARLGNPRRGAEECRGHAAAKWSFIGGQSEAGEGLLDFHLLAMHAEHKTALAFFKLTLDATCRFMPGRSGPAYLLFSDASCAQVDFWLPDNITNTPGVNDDPEEPAESFLNPILYEKILKNQSSGRRLAQHGLDFGPFWRARELGDYILVTHTKSDMQLWLTDEGFVCLAEGNGRLSAVVRNTSLLAEWDYSGEYPNWLATSCLRHTGDGYLPGRGKALEILAADSAGFEADARQILAENMEAFLAYQARRRTDNCPGTNPPSASVSTFSSEYDVFEQLLDNGESSAGLSRSLSLSRARAARSLSDSLYLFLTLSSSLSHTLSHSLNRSLARSLAPSNSCRSLPRAPRQAPKALKSARVPRLL
jgi:hypothetical protein